MNKETEETVICPLSRWYYGRGALLIVLSAGLGLYFLYDGAIGYPKKNRTVDLHEAFEAAKAGEDWQPQDVAVEDGGTADDGGAGASMDADHLAEIEKARQAGRDGISWAGFAAERRLPEKAPERFTAAQIRQQFHFAIGLGAVAAAGGVFLLLVRGRALRCDADSLTFPGGRRILFSAVLVIDLQKWDKGIGRLVYRKNESGSESRVRIDDYKYVGSAEVLRRIQQANPEVEIEGDRHWLWPEGEGAESKSDSKPDDN
jgi:hypothetical protein